MPLPRMQTIKSPRRKWRCDISNILLYKTAQGESRTEVIFNSETFWMPQKRMTELYGVEVNTVNYHLKEIFASGELVEQSVIRKIGITAADGKVYDTNVYNLDAIIAVGYRIPANASLYTGSPRGRRGRSP